VAGRRHLSNPAKGKRRVRVEEVWQLIKELGRGSFGVVYLNKCTSGPGSGQVRAVKRLRKIEEPLLTYHRELEAIAKFSQERVCTGRTEK
jgi:serine/threonine protein kinase